jgi:hypothetical protein
VGGGILRQHGGPGRCPSAARPPRAGEAGASSRGVRLRVTVSAQRGPSPRLRPRRGLPHVPGPRGGRGRTPRHCRDAARSCRVIASSPISWTRRLVASMVFTSVSRAVAPSTRSHPGDSPERPE